MAQELRGAFHRELDRLDIALATLLGLIPEAVDQATAALLDGDSDLSASVARWQGLVEEVYSDVDGTIELVMARQAPVARDLRFLMCCVRIVPEARDAIELIGWLGTHRRAVMSTGLTPRMRRLTLSLAAATSAAWDAVDRLWRERENASVVALRVYEDAGSEIQSSLVAEVAAAGIDVAGAMDMALVIANYDRLTRHALAVGGLVAPLIAGPPA
jgi:phosphate transport system protein